MSSDRSRRNFLKLSGLGTAAIATGNGRMAISAASTQDAPGGEIKVWVTDDNRKLAPAAAIEWLPTSDPIVANTVVLEPDHKFQEILGFGAAFTDASCFTLNRLDPGVREKLFHQLFDPSEMSFNVCRTCIGSSDYSTKQYSYDDGDEPDPELSRFSIEHDRAYILPLLRQAREANPDLFLFSSPWSPPGWMKSNRSMLGGNMRRQYMPAYANYFVKFLESYAAEGVPIQAVTVQNEVDTDQDGRMPACIWPQEYEADFVRANLGPLFQRRGIKTKIWLIDHNYNLWGRAMGELETADVRKYSNAIAWHGYVGRPEWIERVQSAFPDVEMYWTEGGPDYKDARYSSDWADWSATFTDILRHCCRCITAWNFALDESGRPNIGPFSCGGLLTVHSQTKDISYSGQFWAFSHYSRFVRRGARRFESHCTGDTHHVSFENPDGRQVLVLTNPGAARTIQIRVGQKAATLQMGSNSISTLEWHS